MLKFKKKKVLVYGLKSSGQAVVELLLKLKAKVCVFDDNIENLKEYQNEKVFKIFELNEKNVCDFDYMIVSPSVSIFNENIKSALIYGVKVMGELEFAYNFIKGKVYAITGSNGKSTTVSLLAKIFECANKKFELCGNIGKPLTKCILEDNSKKNYIIEVSSFQLETIINFKANICSILNVSENHLDRHFTFENYVNTKKRIFENSRKKDFVVLNYDDENLKYLGNYRQFKTYYFSENMAVKGAYFENNSLMVNLKKFENILTVADIKLFGKHNKQNVLCAVLMAKLAGINNKDILKGVSNFLGLEHRLEFVEEIDGVKYINNSKATTIDATIKSVESFSENVVLLMGGSSKECKPDLLFQKNFLNIKYIVAYGQTADEILESANANKFENIAKAQTLSDAFVVAKEKAVVGDVVLLAPAYASFDQFKNFEERGECFKNLVHELKE